MKSERDTRRRTQAIAKQDRQQGRLEVKPQCAVERHLDQRGCDPRGAAHPRRRQNRPGPELPGKQEAENDGDASQQQAGGRGDERPGRAAAVQSHG